MKKLKAFSPFLQLKIQKSRSEAAEPATLSSFNPKTTPKSMQLQFPDHRRDTGKRNKKGKIEKEGRGEDVFTPDLSLSRDFDVCLLSSLTTTSPPSRNGFSDSFKTSNQRLRTLAPNLSISNAPQRRFLKIRS